MYRLFILLLIFTLSSPATSDPIPAIIAFETVWSSFLFKLAGCPGGKKPLTKEDCRAALGQWDYTLWNRSRESAAKLFKFKE